MKFRYNRWKFRYNKRWFAPKIEHERTLETLAMAKGNPTHNLGKKQMTPYYYVSIKVLIISLLKPLILLCFAIRIHYFVCLNEAFRCLSPTVPTLNTFLVLFPGPALRDDWIALLQWEITIKCLSQGLKDALLALESNLEPADFRSLAQRSSNRAVQ